MLAKSSGNMGASSSSGGKVLGAYDWGYGPHSGYRHFRKGSFENCVFKVGCVGIWYPTNDLIVHHDGTWYYQLTGADA